MVTRIWYAQLLAKLARMAGIELKIQAHQAHFVRNNVGSPDGSILYLFLSKNKFYPMLNIG